MKRALFLLPLFAVLGCHATPTPKDESFVAFVSAKTFEACSDKFFISTNASILLCSCLARQVATNTRATNAFNSKAFKKADIAPNREQIQECLLEVISQ